MDSQQTIEIKPTPNYQSASIVKQVNSEGEKQFMNMENRYEVEKDAIFINYDKQELIKKLKNYSELDIYERITYARHLNVIRDQLQSTHKQLVGEFVQRLVHQCQEIRRHLLQQLKEFVQKDIKETEKPEVYSEIKDIILPALLELLKSGILDIKEQSGNILGVLSSKLKQEDFELIVKAAGDLIGDQEEDNKIVGVQVLSRLSESAQTEFVENFVCKEILKAASSESIRVKKEAILCIPLVCNRISDEFFEKQILPFYQKKCSENSWAVRKACVQIITSIQPRARNVKQKGIISNQLFSLLKDGNKLVKINSHKILPLYISQLTFTHPYHPDDFSFKLLQIYFKLIDSDVNNMAMSSQILYQISYTFPAVLLALGKTYWKKLFPIFSRLLRHTEVKVRQPLAYSFHQIAKIIGEQQSKNCLFECLDNILKDTYDNLKLGAIEHLAEFVEIFNSEVKQNLVDVFLVLQKDPKKWRIRHSIASQLNKLIKIYDCDTVLKYILPISLKLCNDPVAQVSYQASKHVWMVLQSLKQQDSFKLVIQSITGYSQSTRYTQRQVFLEIVKSFSKYPKSFQELIIPQLKTLVKDRIPIVRVRLAELVYGLNQSLKNHQDVKSIIELLKQDPDDDVRYALNPNQTQ